MLFTERVSDEFLALNCCGRQFHHQDRGSHRPKGRRDYHILYIAKGCCYLKEQGREWVAEAGSLILYRPGEPQHYRFKGGDGSVSLYLHFSGRGCKDLLDRLGFRGRIHPLRESDLPDRRFQRLAEAYYGNAPFKEEQCAALLYHFLVTLGQLQGEGPGRIRDICRRMEDELAEAHSIGYYAELCGLSESRFSHLFKEKVGKSPKAYLTDLQIQTGCRLLSSTDLPVERVACAVGIGDANYFSRLVKKKTGNTPLQIRRGYDTI